METTRWYYSPLRYPGGKSWLEPMISSELSSMTEIPKCFLEPFAGGATVGLAILSRRLCRRLILVEKDSDVAALWQVIFGKDAEWLANQIITFEPNLSNVNAVLDRNPRNAKERAFRLLLKNRVTHGGRVSRTGGLLRNGERGNGVLSRWYPVTIVTRIRMLARLAAAVQVIHGDGIAVMKQHAGRKTTCMFIDPPYTAGAENPGIRLYDHYNVDHEAIFKISSYGPTPAFLTYADSKPVRSLAKKYGFLIRSVEMKNTHHRSLRELLLTKRA